MSIFDKRVNYKPFEYPEVNVFIDAMNKTFWVHSEVEFDPSIQDFKILPPHKKELFVRAVLSIAQVEVAVKTFWGELYNHFPKPEFNNLGSTFAESETRHSEAYSRVLDVLNLNERFSEILEVPAFKRKLALIEKVMKDPTVGIETKILFFTLVIENSSLFAQFGITTSFARFEGTMKNLSNMISWSAIDEATHSEAGIWLLNEIQKEKDIFTDIDIESTVKEYVEVESEMLDWIFEEGEFEHFSKEDLLYYIKYRLDEALSKIKFDKVFNVTPEQVKPMMWFEEEIYANSLDDFFSQRPTEYTKHDKSFTADDLF